MTTLLSTRRATRVASPVSPAPKASATPAAGWHRATVSSDPATGLRLRVGTHEVSARQAFSCLVALRRGDTVAALLDEGAQWWVMSVLEREGAQDVVLRSEGSLALEAPVLRARASEALELAAPQVRLQCEQADAVGDRLNLIGGAMKAIGATLSTLFDRAHHHAGQHLRTTEGLDRTQAQHLELQAKQLLQIHAEHALIEGEQLVKARGGQIHFG